MSQRSPSTFGNCKILTQVSADVDVEVDGVVAVVHQVAAAHFDQRVEVVLLAVRVKHVAGNLDGEQSSHLEINRSNISCVRAKPLLN